MLARIGVLTFIALALSACGSGGGSASETKTFDETGFAISFEYPGNFKVLKDVTFAEQAGNPGSASNDRAVGLDAKNMILVSRFDLKIAVTDANIDQVKSEVDRLMSQLAHTELTGNRVTVGGLPGFEYAFALSKPKDAKSRIFIVFDQKTQYELNCQSTPEKGAEIDRACGRMTRTLHSK